MTAWVSTRIASTCPERSDIALVVVAGRARARAGGLGVPRLTRRSPGLWDGGFGELERPAGAAVRGDEAATSAPAVNRDIPAGTGHYVDRAGGRARSCAATGTRPCWERRRGLGRQNADSITSIRASGHGDHVEAEAPPRRSSGCAASQRAARLRSLRCLRASTADGRRPVAVARPRLHLAEHDDAVTRERRGRARRSSQRQLRSSTA